MNKCKHPPKQLMAFPWRSSNSHYWCRKCNSIVIEEGKPFDDSLLSWGTPIEPATMTKEQLKALYIRKEEANDKLSEAFDRIPSSIDERFEWELTTHEFRVANDIASEEYSQAFEEYMYPLRKMPHPALRDFKRGGK